MYRLNTIPINIPGAFQHWLADSKIYMEKQKSIIIKPFEKKKQIKGFTLPSFKTFKAIIINTVWYWHKSRHRDQWNWIQPRKRPVPIFPIIFFNKSAKDIQWRKHSLFKKRKLDLKLVSRTKINSKWIIESV